MHEQLPVNIFNNKRDLNEFWEKAENPKKKKNNNNNNKKKKKKKNAGC